MADKLDFSFFLVDPEGYIDLIQLFIPAGKFTEEELVKRCRSLIRMSKQHLGVEPVLYISEVRPLYLMARGLNDKQKVE